MLWHRLFLQVLCELGFRTGHFCAVCPGWDGVLWHWLSLQVLCEHGSRTGHFCAVCPGWDWVLWHWLSLQVLCELAMALAALVGTGCYGTGLLLRMTSCMQGVRWQGSNGFGSFTCVLHPAGTCAVGCIGCSAPVQHLICCLQCLWGRQAANWVCFRCCAHPLHVGHWCGGSE